MCMNMNNNRINTLLLVLAGVVVATLSWLTPLSADDYCYQMIVGQEPLRIESLGDVITSIAYHYTHSNGRSIVHALIQIFDGILGKTIFCIVNGFVFIAFVILMRRLAGIEKQEWHYTLLLIALIMLFIPSFNETIVWLSGSVNYLWASTAALGCLYLMQRDKDLPSGLGWMPIFLLIGIICGWSHESCATALVGGAGLYYCLNFKRFRGVTIPLFIGLCLGTAMLIFSPGTMGRAGGAGLLSSGFSATVIRIVGGMFNFLIDGIPTAVVLILGTLVLLFTRTRTKEFIKQNQLQVLMWGVAVLFSLFVGGATHRSMFFVSTLSLVVLMRGLKYWNAPLKMVHFASYLLSFATVLVLVLVVPAMVENCKASTALHQKIEAAEGSDVVIPHDIYYPQGKLEKRYIKAELGSGHGYKTRDWEMVAVARIAGKESVTVLPTALYNSLYESDCFCTEGHMLLDGLYTTHDIPFFIKHVGEGESIDAADISSRTVEYQVKKASSEDLGGYTLRQRLFMPILSKYKAHTEQHAESLTIVNLPSGRYWLIDKIDVRDNRYEKVEF